jgi:biopolymer transport protein ExbD
MSASSGDSDRAEPNLTPILDMVFQLITFFMLVVNFKAATLDLNLKLPAIGSALPSESADREVLVLNIDTEGQLLVYGEVKDMQQYILQESQLARRQLEADNPDAKPADELPVTVVIRADRTTPFHLINQVITTCQSHGYRKFQYRALSVAAEA